MKGMDCAGGDDEVLSSPRDAGATSSPQRGQQRVTQARQRLESLKAMLNCFEDAAAPSDTPRLPAERMPILNRPTTPVWRPAQGPGVRPTSPPWSRPGSSWAGLGPTRAALPAEGSRGLGKALVCQWPRPLLRLGGRCRPPGSGSAWQPHE